jgi:microcystin-dependent protein
MGLEAATYINDLDTSNPLSTDFRSQGDDHLRLLKLVLKNSIKRVTRPLYVPGIGGVFTTDYNVQASDDQVLLQVNPTSGPITITLPVLTSSDAGWSCRIIKVGGNNPMFIVPPSGNLVSGELITTKARRRIPYVQMLVTWSGGVFFVERAARIPIGTILDFAGANLPMGYEWANGQALSSASYPEYNTLIGGTTPDRRGRVAVGRDDMGGAAAGRVTNAGSGVDGATIGAAGGTETITLITANLPPYTPAGTIAASGSITGSSSDITGNNGGPGGSSQYQGSASNTNSFHQTPAITINDARTWAFTGTAQGGTSTPVRNMPPSMVANMIVVVE